MIRTPAPKTIDPTNLWEFLTPGVWAILNGAEKLVDVRHSANIMRSVTRHLTDIKDGEHSLKELIRDRDKLVVWVLEMGVHDFQTRLLLQSQWLRKFRDLGFSFYRERPALTYRVKVDIVEKLVYVRLINKMKRGITVGVFSNMADTEEFIHQYYSHDLVLTPVYAINELTQKYLTDSDIAPM